MALAPQESFSGSAPTRVTIEACCKIFFTSSGLLAFSIGARPASKAFCAASGDNFTSIAEAG